MLNQRSDKLELLRIVEAVATEKSIDREIILSSMESAIEKAAKTKFGLDNNIRATIDRESGDINLHKVLKIVETPINFNTEISLEHAIEKEKKENVKIGDEIFEQLPQVDLGRVAAQTARQVITQNVRQAERERQYNDFIEKKGEILSGIVKRLEYGNLIVDLNRAEAIITKDELIPREILKMGDRIKAYCYNVIRENKGQQIFLSRAHPKFMEKLFFQEVPEIYEGIIEIKSATRDPGSRAKISVSSKDSSIDPVGACVGMRGSRVQSVVNELHGEKIDIVHWSEDPAVLVVSALAPAEIQRVIIDDQNRRIEVILTEENLSKAIGRRGQNVRLASKLINYEIDILTAKEESEKRQLEFKDKTEIFIKNLEVDETLGQLLVAEGFSSIEEIHQSTLEEILKIEAIEENTAKELKERAEEYLKKEKEDIGKKLKELGVEDVLINFKGLTPGMLVTLGEKKIKTLKDFADLSTDELIGSYDEKQGKRFKIEGFLEEFALAKNEADDLIMNARNIVFK
ncbi:MAG: transcription termination/antitermination protein NusA [Alphaproteobacteria bacterium]|nr:MAG: transcription termination/antitermination protein NusA [Alphaproteobacteria bacterium]